MPTYMPGPTPVNPSNSENVDSSMRTLICKLDSIEQELRHLNDYVSGAAEVANSLSESAMPVGLCPLIQGAMSSADRIGILVDSLLVAFYK